MRRFTDRLGIRGKILAGNAVLLLLFVLGLGGGLWVTNRAGEAARHLREEAVPTLNLLGDIHGAGARLLAETGNYVALALLNREDAAGAAADARFREKEARLTADERAQLGEMQDRLRDAFAALESISLHSDEGEKPGDHAMIDDLRQHLGNLVAAMIGQSSEIERLAQTATKADTLERLEVLEATEQSFEETIQHTKRLEVAEAEALQAAIDRRLSAALWMSAAALLAGVVLVGASSLFIARRIGGPIVALRDMARRLGAGDLDVRPARGSADEIGELEDAFVKMAQDLRDSIERQTRQSRLAGLGELAGTVNHELRNPLSTICNSLVTLRRRMPAADGETVRLLDRIDRNVERCIHIVGDFLDFARPPVAARAPTGFDAWLIEVLEEYQFPPSVDVERVLAAPVKVELDGERFRRVLLNLLDNAVQAMTDAGWQPAPASPRRITVRTAVAGRELLLSVADTGPGILPEHMAKVFEPLFTTKSFGIGLGLAAVRRIVGQHDGTIAVDGSTGPGVCFTIRLPLARQDMRGAA